MFDPDNPLTHLRQSSLTLILDSDQSRQAIQIAQAEGIRDFFLQRGKGTVRPSIWRHLGITSDRREAIHFVLPTERAKALLDRFDRQLELDKPGHGIAYACTIRFQAGAGDCAVPTDPAPDRPQPADSAPAAHVSATMVDDQEVSMYHKITTVVELGKADDVLDAARDAGARGGTIFHGRGCTGMIAHHVFGMEIEPEKEIVMILVPTSILQAVIDRIHQALDLDKPGNGLLFAETVSDVRGLFRGA